jgi:predicted adenylyl cyclase CyaB
MLTSLFGILAVVSKTRHLYLYKNARIHIDMVRGLGTFVEFEVLVKRGKQQARRLMRELTKVFSIAPRSTMGISYSDLLFKKTARRR